MRINTVDGWIRYAVSHLTGLGNLVTQKLDEDRGWTDPVKNSNFAYTALLHIGGLAVNLAEIETNISEVVVNSSSWKLQEHIKNIIQSRLGTAAFTPPAGRIIPRPRPRPAPAVAASSTGFTI